MDVLHLKLQTGRFTERKSNFTLYNIWTSNLSSRVQRYVIEVVINSCIVNIPTLVLVVIPKLSRIYGLLFPPDISLDLQVVKTSIKIGHH